MFLTILDLILLLILFLFIAFGFALGLIQTVGALIGIVLGVWVAGVTYGPVGDWLAGFLLNNKNLADIVAFIIIFTLVNRAAGLVFWIVNKIFKVFSIIPFTKGLNRLLGALFGFIEGVLFLGVILYFISRYNFADWFAGVLTGSKVAVFLVDIASVLAPLLPEMVQKLNSVI